MATSRLVLLPALFLVACQSEDGVVPIGVHFQYVVGQAALPTSSAQATELGLDLDGDGDGDNKLGMVLAAIMATAGIDVQAAMTAAIDRGDIILLLDLQANSLSSWRRAGLQVVPGDKASAMPAPCADPADTLCRQHLDGTGRFGAAAGSPDDLPLVGAITDGTFTGGPGNLSLQLALGGPEGVRLDLIGARAQASGLSEAGIERVILAGGIPEESIEAQLLPALHREIHSRLVQVVTADCTGTTPPECGCAIGSTGRTILNLLDTSPKDCVVTLEEVQSRSELESIVAPDLTIDGQRVLSFGMEVSAVKAAFAVPL